MRDRLPERVRKYIGTVINAAPSVTEVWLVGSQANDRAAEESDWDFLVFADQEALMLLRENVALACANIDVLVVVDGNRFESPWPRSDKPGKLKRGHLQNYFNADGIEVIGWEWERLGENEVTYTGEAGCKERAVLIYRRDSVA